MKAELNIHLTPTTDAPWTELPGIALGREPAGLGTPVLYGLVDRAGEPVARLDVYGDPGSESYFAAEALGWHDRVVVGFGWSVYVVSPGTGEVTTFRLPCYFQAFWPAPGSVLVVSGNG